MTPKYIPLIALIATTSVIAAPKQAKAFTQLDVSGPFTVTIKQGSHPGFTAQKPSAVASQVLNNVLTLWPTINKNGQATPTKITVTVANLSRLVVSGNTKVQSSKVNFPSIDVIDESSGSVNLLGEYGLKHLTVSGTGPIQIHWLKSKRLSVHAVGTAQIKLAGVANNVYASLYNSAKLNARYLRAKTVNVKTYQNSVATVTPLQLLNAFAFDKSSVFYYKYPKSKNQVTNIEGHVLQLGW